MSDVVVMAGSAVGSVLGLLQELTKHYSFKAYVVCIGTDYKKIFESSQYVDDCFVIQSRDRKFFIDEMEIWYSNKNFLEKPILYFTTDTACYMANTFRQWFEIRFHLCLPSSEIIETFTKKGLAEFEAEKNGLKIPKTRVISDVDSIIDIQRSFKFPVIIKPRSTYDDKPALFKVKILNIDEFVTFLTPLISQGYTFVSQEFIPGDDSQSFFYIFFRSESGEITDVIGRKVLQNPPGAGIMAKGIIEEHEKLLIECRDFINKINYVGIGGIEFKKNNDIHYFIELSTRLEGFFKISNHLPYTIAQHSYESTIGLNTEGKADVDNTAVGKVYFDIFATIIAHFKLMNMRRFISDVWEIMFGKGVVLNTYDKTDKGPLFKHINKLVKRR